MAKNAAVWASAHSSAPGNRGAIPTARLVPGGVSPLPKWWVQGMATEQPGLQILRKPRGRAGLRRQLSELWGVSRKVTGKGSHRCSRGSATTPHRERLPHRRGVQATW